MEFKNSRFDSSKINNSKFYKCNFDKTYFGRNFFNNAIFLSCDFTNTDLLGVNFSNTNLMYSIFDGGDLKNVNFYEADITGCSFKYAKGLASAENLEKSHFNISKDKPNNRVKYFDYCIREFPEKWCDWEKLRIFGKMPLFGASYATLVLIPLFFYFLAIYNNNIDIVIIYATQLLSVNQSDALALLLVERLHPLHVPNLSLVLLLSTLCLAIASTIYALACPSRIKEFSSDQWTGQLGQSLVHYWALSWKYRYARLICIFFYLVGGLGVLWVIVTKVFNAAIFIWNSV